MRLFPNDPVLSAFLDKYDEIPEGDRERLPWEAVAVAAEINPQHFIGSVMIAMEAASVNSVKILALSNHARVTKKTIEYALLPSGERDRSLIHQSLGFAKPSNGPTFIAKAVFGSAGRIPNNDDDEDIDKNEAPSGPAIFTVDDDINKLFPDVEQIQESLIPIRQRLTDGKK